MGYGSLPGCCPSLAEPWSGLYLHEMCFVSPRESQALHKVCQTSLTYSCCVVLCSIELKKSKSANALRCCCTWLWALRNKWTRPLQTQIMVTCTTFWRSKTSIHGRKCYCSVFAVENVLWFLHQAHTKAVVHMKPFYKGFVEMHQ